MPPSLCERQQHTWLPAVQQAGGKRPPHTHTHTHTLHPTHTHTQTPVSAADETVGYGISSTLYDHLFGSFSAHLAKKLR